MPNPVESLFTEPGFVDLLLGQLGSGIIITDETGRIGFLNPAAQTLLQLSPSQGLGKALNETLLRFTPTDGVEGQRQVSLPSGQFPVQVLRLSKGKQIAGYLVVVREVPVRTEDLEDANRRLQEVNVELAKANQLKSDFVANMSHELRSPLNDILGFTQLFLSRTYGEINPRQEEAMQLVSESAHVLLDLINSILDLSKLEAGDRDVVEEAVLVGEVIEEVYRACGPLVRGKPIKLRVDVDAEMPPIVSDRRKVRQVLMNLVHNAIKFTKRGSIKMTGRLLRHEGKVEISVEDTGIGIDKNHQDIIFDAFRQVDGSATREYGGTGLGLAITKKVLDLIGGQISVKSAPGVGSTFRVILPLDSTGGRLNSK